MQGFFTMLLLLAVMYLLLDVRDEPRRLYRTRGSEVRPFEKSSLRKQILVFDDQALQTLDRLKEAMGDHATYSDVLRHAVGLYEWARKQTMEGYNFGAVGRDGKAKVAVLPFGYWA